MILWLILIYFLNFCTWNKVYFLLSQPPPPLDLDKTKRSDSEPSVEKARFDSLPRANSREFFKPVEPANTLLEQMGSHPVQGGHESGAGSRTSLTNTSAHQDSENRPSNTSRWVYLVITSTITLASCTYDKSASLHVLRSAADMADLSSSDPPLDSKQQRKLRQQQLQQKFRQEMEAKKLLQEQKSQQTNGPTELLPLQSKQGVMENLRVHVLAMSIKDSSFCLRECQVCSALHRWVYHFRTSCRSC